MTANAQVNGVILLSIAQACIDLELFLDDRSRSVLSNVRPEGWYDIGDCNLLLDFITGYYTDAEIILEQIGIEMMRIWYHNGPGRNIVNSGIDFLRHQTSSAGYYSLVRGDRNAIGEFTLLALDEAAGTARVRCTTPFNIDLQRGILRGGMSLSGDLCDISVQNTSDDASNLRIRFSHAGNQQLRLTDLQQELEQRQAFWRATNRTLSRALGELREKEKSLAETNAELHLARAESEMLKEAVVNVAPDAVISIDEKSRIIEFNRSAEHLFGIARHAALGRDLAQIIIPEPQRQAHHDGMQRYLGGAPSSRLDRPVEVEAQRADGSRFPARLSISEIQLPDRRLFTAYLQDLSEQKQAEIQIEQQRQALAQKEKLSALGSLLAGVAHELNNPLAILVGRAALLEMDTRDERLLESIGEIRTAADRCSKIVKTFLSMARQQAPERIPCQLNEIIRDALAIVEYSLHTADIEVIIDLQSDLPGVSVDPVQIGQVFANLLINAQQALLKVSHQRRLHLVTRADAVTETVTASVSDNGPGVAADIRSRIFDPFYTTKPVGHGTGIGLTVSHNIVNSHQGTLHLETPAGGGACFVISLPSDKTISEFRPDGDAGQEQEKAAGNQHILVIDDEHSLAQTVRLILERAGYRVSIAGSGNQGLTMLAETSFDLILCDIHMPDLNGPDFYTQLELDYPLLAGRIAFLTGDTLGDTSQGFLQQVQRPVLAKPFTPADLMAFIKPLLD